MSVKFRGSNREMPKNRSKFTEKVIFDFFQFPVYQRFSVVLLLDGFCWEYLDASKMLPLVMIGVMQSFCRWVKVTFFLKFFNFEDLQISHQQTVYDEIEIFIKVQIPPLKDVQICKNLTENVEATSNNMTHTLFGKKCQIQLFFLF